MAKRGRRQQDGLRFHKGNRQWYRVFDGKEKYFGPSGVSLDDAPAKATAEREWHLHEADQTIPMLIRVHSVEDARRELVEMLGWFVVNDDGEPDTTTVEARVTDDVAAEWLRSAGKLSEQRQMLFRLGARPCEVDNDPGIWAQLTVGGWQVNPAYTAQGEAHRRIALERFYGGDSLANLQSTDTSPTCKEVVRYYVSYLERHAARSSYVDARARLQHWLKQVGEDRKTGHLKHADFVAYRDHWWERMRQRKEWEETQAKPIPLDKKRKAPGVAAATANKHLTLVKAAFSRYRKDKGLDVPGLADGLCALERRGGNSIREIPLFEPADIRLMLETFDLYWQAITMLALNMAASNTDIDGIQWHHIDFEYGYLNYPRTKNNRPRRLPLWRRTIRLLTRYRKQCRSVQYIFPNRHGGRLITYGKKTRTDNLSINFRKKMKSLGLCNTFAAFRKSTATAAKRYCDGDTVLMILGDAPPGMWAKYVMPIPELVAEPIKRVEEYYFGSSGDEKSQAQGANDAVPSDAQLEVVS
jgi:integrase